MNKELQQKIFHMRDADLMVRGKIHAFLDGDFKRKVSQELVKEIFATDESHHQALKEILKNYGWPGIDLVGEEGSEAFWLLIQHQDKDVELQAEALKLLEQEVKKGNASRVNLAYLTDRVRVGKGLPQVFGTQWGQEGQYPVEDPEQLSHRRKEMGLD